jgi:peptide methionine sulfoxide reductase msrA/msrB
LNVKRINISLFFASFMLIIFSCAQIPGKQTGNIKSSTMDTSKDKPGNPYYSHTDTTKLNLSDAEWKKVLPSDVFAVMRQKETETAFTGKYWNFFGKGTYYCAACGNPLFRADAKFASSCGWPSFFEQMNKNSVVYKEDNSYRMNRIEALCGRCGGHLGHLFDDGPEPTGKRYCMNSIALDFEADNKSTDSDSANNIDTLTLGGGCFWCIDAVYENLLGIISVVSGYSGGTVKNPTYEEVCTGKTNHVEVVQIIFDKTITSLDEIFKVFFTVHDPTQLNKQGDDIGTQYRSVIFYRNDEQKIAAESIIKALTDEKVYDKPIVTKVEKFTAFYKAENYHQDYYDNNKNQPYCRMVIQPKLEKFEKVFKDRIKPK